MIFKRSRSLREIFTYNRLANGTIETSSNAGHIDASISHQSVVSLDHFQLLIQHDEMWTTIWNKSKHNLDVPKCMKSKNMEEESHYTHFVLFLPEELTEQEIPTLAFSIASTCWNLFQNIDASKFKTDPNTSALTELHEKLYKWATERSKTDAKALVMLAQKLYQLKSFHSVVAILWALALGDYKVPGNLSDWGSPAKNFGTYRQELEESTFGIPFVGIILKDMEFSSVGIFLDDEMINLQQLATFYNSSVKMIEKFQRLNGKSRPQLSRQRSLLGNTLRVSLS